VHEHDVIRPDGQPGFYGVIETRIAVGVIALTPQQEIYLIGQYRYPTEHYSWEIVEGGTEENEDPLVTAKRELREEAGLTAVSFTPLGEEVHLSNCISSERAVFFIAEGLTEVGAEPEATEVLEVRKVPLDDAFALVASGEIRDAMSIIALYRLQALLQMKKQR